MAVIAESRTLFHANKEIIYKVIKRIKHPGYADRGGICYNDIGLLKVDRAIDFDHNHVEAINFKDTIDVNEGMVLRVAGWGKTEVNFQSNFCQCNLCLSQDHLTFI